MLNFKQIERLQKVHKLIAQRNTGTPKQFARNVHVSERHLYNIIEYLRELDAIVCYDKKFQSYYFEESFDLDVQISVRVLTRDEVRNIYGGSKILSENKIHTERLLQFPSLI